MILIPARDIEDVAAVLAKIRTRGDVTGPLYVAVSDDQIEIREGTNVTYGARRFAAVDPSR